MTPDLRIVCTNDFLSSLSPMRTSYAELSPEELEAVVEFTAPEPWLGWGTASTTTGPGPGTTIAAPRDYVDWATVQIGQILGRDLTWRASDVRLRDAIRSALGRGEGASD